MSERTTYRQHAALDVRESPEQYSDHRQNRRPWRFRRGAKALITTADCVLVVRERHADGTAFWTLPGGGAREHESLPTALRREIVEELHSECLVGDPKATFWYVHESRPRTTSRYTVFECRLLAEPSPSQPEGVEQVQWADRSMLPAKTIPGVRTIVGRGTG